MEATRKELQLSKNTVADLTSQLEAKDAVVHDAEARLVRSKEVAAAAVAEAAELRRQAEDAAANPMQQQLDKLNVEYVEHTLYYRLTRPPCSSTCAKHRGLRCVSMWST